MDLTTTRAHRSMSVLSNSANTFIIYSELGLTSPGIDTR